MSPELIAILAVGVGILTANAGLAALLVTLLVHFDRRATERADRLQDEMNRQFELMRADMDRRFDAQDERVRGLERGQAHLAGQFDILKDYFTHQPGSE